MVADNLENINEDPQYQKALRHFQLGEWDAGLDILEALIEKFPLENNLRSLRQEMRLRAKIDNDEVVDIADAKQKRFRRIGLRVGALVFTVLILFFVIAQYAQNIQNEYNRLREAAESDLQDIETSVKFRNAQNLLNAGHITEARTLLEDVQANDPNFEGLEELLAKIENVSELDAAYDRLLDLVAREEWGAALEALETVEEMSPGFRDTGLLRDQIERNLMIDQWIREADAAYAEARWKDAAAGYESVRVVAPTYQQEKIEERLLTSLLNAAEIAVSDSDDILTGLEEAENYYQKALAIRPQNDQILEQLNATRSSVTSVLVDGYLRAAQAALVEQQDSLAALEIAEKYFSQAAALKPNDPAIKQQLSMATRYLAALDQFSQGLWDSAITNLEVVTSDNPDYAEGTAQQTLYELYILRGNNRLAGGEYEEALTDFRRAVEIAQRNPEGTLLLYEAQLKVAYALGLLRDYEEAVALYQFAVSNSNLLERLGDDNRDLVNELQKAENFADRGDFKLAYLRYRDLLIDSAEIYDVTVLYVVQDGDYLTSIARQFNTTVKAIVAANDILNPNKIVVGQELVVPILE
jgi:tetratricopeptide (TPR) repeat protein